MPGLKPRFAEYPPTVIAGLAARYHQQTKSGIPALWQQFAPYIGSVPGQVGATTYGYCWKYQPDGSFEYLCGVQVSGAESLPAELKAVEIPRMTYAVFAHTGHISGIAATWAAIFSEWLPGSGYTHEEEPDFEVYTDQFNPRTGFGLVEIWIALKAGSPN